MSKKIEKIKPCPFCGLKVKIHLNDPKTVVCVSCKKCGIDFYFFDKKGVSTTALAWYKPTMAKENVLKAFNKRAK